MNKKLIALAIAAAIAPAAALADSGNVTISGKVAADVTFVNGTGVTGTADNNTHQVNNNNSVITLGMNEDLGNGNKAFTSLTYGLPLTSGGTITGQNQIIGLEGKTWGKVFAGAFDNPLKVMGRGTDLFADQSTGDARALTAVGAVEARANDVVAYITPSFSGVQLVLAHSNNPLGTVASDGVVNNGVAATAGTITGVNTTTAPTAAVAATSMASSAMNIVKLAYANGPLSAALGYHNIDSGLAGGAGDEKATRLTAGYDAGAFKVVGSWQKVDNSYVNSNDYKVWGLGAAYKMGATTLKGQYYKLSNDTAGVVTSNANMLALGADYSMSKRTTLQLAYSKVNNDASVSYGGASGVAGADSLAVAAGSDPTRLSLGMKHTF